MKRIALIVLIAVISFTVAAFAEMETVVDIPVMAMPVMQKNEQLSMTTGLRTEKENRTMVVQMDNEAGARPQKGIASADIVYETEIYNGGYTRYTAVFNDVIPDLIESTRSTRKVNVDYYKEYGGAFVHYGSQTGVSDAEAYMAEVGMYARYDGIKGISGFYRDSARKAPNNVACKLKELYDKTDWSTHVQKSPLKFSDVGYTRGDMPVSEFSIIYRSGSYQPGYIYKDGKYYRYYNGNAYKDGTTGEHVTCDNVIVQHVTYDWYDSAAPIVGLYGTGVCEYFIDGYHFTGYWERVDVNSNTTYYDADGNEVLFKPGKTFVQVVKQGVAVNINGTEAPGTLKNGSRGEEVKKLQQKLVNMGLLNDAVDGIYGNNTAAAVSAAEALLGMEQTGVANPDFLEVLYAQ